MQKRPNRVRNNVLFKVLCCLLDIVQAIWLQFLAFAYILVILLHRPESSCYVTSFSIKSNYPESYRHIADAETYFDGVNLSWKRTIWNVFHVSALPTTGKSEAALSEKHRVNEFAAIASIKVSSLLGVF